MTPFPLPKIFAIDNPHRHRHYPKSKMHLRVRAPADYFRQRLICADDYLATLHFFEDAIPL
jgi:hypothetical protein